MKKLHLVTTTFVAFSIMIPLVLAPAPAQAGRMIWSMVDTPSNYFNIIVSPSEVSAFVIGADGRAMYAVDTDTANSRVYRSDDAGTSWNDLSNYLVTAGAVLPAWNISVAPDNPLFVAAVTSTLGLPRRVFVSVHGGQNWNDTNLAAPANISSISVSPYYGNYDIAAGTRTGAGAGTIFTCKSAGIGGTWVAQGFGGDVLSLKFSPGYRTDSSIAVLYTNAAGTFFNVGIRDLNANTTNWNAIYAGGPPEITTGGAGTSPKANQIITGDVDLPADFSGQAPSLCRAYISLDASGGNAGIYRLDNNIVYWLMTATSSKRISSISYFGTYASGKLLAGEVLGDPVRATVMTWFTDAPNTCPATCWYPAEKPPTGAGTSGYGNAQVAWTPDGSRAYCGTSSALLNTPWPSGYLNGVALDESAFSISRDNGRLWDQLSLIDTHISFLSDVAVAADSNTIYLASINTEGASLDSIWRSTGQTSGKSWERVLCLLSSSNDLILRMSNFGNDPAIFLASRSTNDLRQSQDAGQTWKELLPGMVVNDFSVTSLNNARFVYVLSSTYMRRGNVSSLIPQWSQQVATTLSAGHTIFAAPTGVIVVGGDTADTRTAFSLDGGASFAVTTPFPIAGHIHALVDYRFREAAIIYAASDSPGSDIYNYVIGMSPSWEYMGAPNARFWGLAQMGTLYGATENLPGAAVDRTLSPESLGPPAIEWDVLATGLLPGVVFTREPISLKLSSGINLWAIDNRPYSYPASTGRLWNFCDCLSPSPQYTPPPPPPPKELLFAAPIAISPGAEDIIPVFITDNSVDDITFVWKHNSAALAYELWLAGDSSFNQVITQKTISPQNRRAPSWNLIDKTGIETGKTYYWKVRVVQAVTGEKGTGEWSQPLSFSVAENKSKTPATPPAPPSVVDNRTTGIPQPGLPANPPPVSENKTAQQGALSFVSINFWLWIVIAALVVCVVVAVISGARTGKEKG